MDEKVFVSLNKEEYDKLVRDSLEYTLLVEALMKNSKLYQYGGVSELTFPNVEDIIRYLLPLQYLFRLEQLIEKTENKEDKE